MMALSMASSSLRCSPFPPSSPPLSSSFQSLSLSNKKKKKPSSSSPVVAMSMEAGVGVMGTKLGMMTYFEPTGAAVPVTVVGFREGNVVTQVKTAATDGYDAVQVGYRRVRDRKLTKPELGHLQKAGAVPLRHLQEFRLQSVEDFEPGQRLVLEEIFKEGDLVDVSGTSIGKGFQGNQINKHLVGDISEYPHRAPSKPGRPREPNIRPKKDKHGLQTLIAHPL